VGSGSSDGRDLARVADRFGRREEHITIVADPQDLPRSLPYNEGAKATRSLTAPRFSDGHRPAIVDLLHDWTVVFVLPVAAESPRANYPAVRVVTRGAALRLPSRTPRHQGTRCVFGVDASNGFGAFVVRQDTDHGSGEA
jgi:hypothetical protein